LQILQAAWYLSFWINGVFKPKHLFDRHVATHLPDIFTNRDFPGKLCKKWHAD